MSEILNKNLFFIKEHVGMFKAANNYDILDPESKEIILECREEKLGFFTKLFRFTKYKRYTPFDIEIRTPQGETLIRIKKGVSFFLSKPKVYNHLDEQIGGFNQKMFSLGGAFSVVDENNQEVCELKGKWTGWDFKFKSGDYEFAHVTKEWAGIGKELFTSADNYVLEISEDVPLDSNPRKLIIAAVMCIDMVLKE